jgi:hypothetical protein
MLLLGVAAVVTIEVLIFTVRAFAKAIRLINRYDGWR